MEATLESLNDIHPTAEVVTQDGFAEESPTIVFHL